MRRLAIAGALLVAVLTIAPVAGASPRAAKPVAGPSTYIPKAGAACKSGYHKATATKTEKVKVRVKVKGKLKTETKTEKVRYVECEKTVAKATKPAPTTTTSTSTTTTTTTTTTSPPPPTTTTTTLPAVIQTQTAVDESAIFPNVIVTADAIGDNSVYPPGNLFSVSIIDEATNTVLGTWTANPSTNPTPPTVVTIEWTFGLNGQENTVLTLKTTPIQGVTWNGPATVIAPEADVDGVDIDVQATFEGETGYASSTSALTTLPI